MIKSSLYYSSLISFFRSNEKLFKYQIIRISHRRLSLSSITLRMIKETNETKIHNIKDGNPLVHFNRIVDDVRHDCTIKYSYRDTKKKKKKSHFMNRLTMTGDRNENTQV